MAKTKRLLKRFEDAAVNLAWLGSMLPDEEDSEAEQAYKKAKAKLTEHLENIEKKLPKHVVTSTL